ncbi:MAG: TIM barrel protein [Coriobacteriales bacterium]|jgi:sugar phosphate isomerase/epimerase|nr:TIM barrel protein [Coriobacteriales bacterium]
MKTMFNLSTSSDDMRRYSCRDELLAMMDGFDGVELSCFETDERRVIPPERVVGLHMSAYPYWFDFWNRDEAALTREFGSLELCEQYYGGSSREALLTRFRRDIARAKAYEVEYLVFHVSDASAEESFTRVYRHSDQEIIEAASEILNILFASEDGSLVLLLENLWFPGLNLTNPRMTRHLLDCVAYPNAGIMLDTGHLMHTDTKLSTQKDALRYIHEVLDAHGELCDRVRGIHLNQSLTGEYAERMMREPPVLKETFAERYAQMFEHGFSVDRHLPFTCAGVGDLIRRIAPDYLTFEFITRDKPQHKAYLKAQWTALGGPGCTSGF